MNQDIIRPQRRAGSVSRVIRVLVTIAALTGVGLSLGACTTCYMDENGDMVCGPALTPFG